MSNRSTGSSVELSACVSLRNAQQFDTADRGARRCQFNHHHKEHSPCRPTNRTHPRSRSPSTASQSRNMKRRTGRGHCHVTTQGDDLVQTHCRAPGRTVDLARQAIPRRGDGGSSCRQSRSKLPQAAAETSMHPAGLRRHRDTARAVGSPDWHCGRTETAGARLWHPLSMSPAELEAALSRAAAIMLLGNRATRAGTPTGNRHAGVARCDHQHATQDALWHSASSRAVTDGQLPSHGVFIGRSLRVSHVTAKRMCSAGGLAEQIAAAMRTTDSACTRNPLGWRYSRGAVRASRCARSDVRTGAQHKRMGAGWAPGPDMVPPSNFWVLPRPVRNPGGHCASPMNSFS